MSLYGKSIWDKNGGVTVSYLKIGYVKKEVKRILYY